MVCQENFFINIMDLDSWQITKESTPMAKFNRPGAFGVGKDLYLLYNSRASSDNMEKAWRRDGETGQWHEVKGMPPYTTIENVYVVTFIPDDFYSC